MFGFFLFSPVKATFASPCPPKILTYQFIYGRYDVTGSLLKLTMTGHGFTCSNLNFYDIQIF